VLLGKRCCCCLQGVLEKAKEGSKGRAQRECKRSLTSSIPNPSVLYARSCLEEGYTRTHLRYPHTHTHTYTHTHPRPAFTATRTHSNLEQPRTASPLLSTTRRQYNIGSIISSGYAPLTPLLLSFSLPLYLSPFVSFCLLLSPSTSLPLYSLTLLFSYSPSLLQFLLLSSFLVYFIFTPLLLSFSLLLSPFISFSPSPPSLSLTSYLLPLILLLSFSLLQFHLLSSFLVYFIFTLGQMY